MPRQLTITEIHLKNISTCVAITANTPDILVNTLKISALAAILNTTQSLLKMVETIKQDKDDCAELMEHIDKLLNAIIGVYLKSDTGAELPPSILNQITTFTETLHKIHTFVEAQQSGSKVKKIFRQGELNALLKNCKAELQQGLAFFQAGPSILARCQLTRVKRSGQLQMCWLMLRRCKIRHSSDTKRYSTLLKQCPVQIQLLRYLSSNSISMLPAEPKIFHGRDSELAEILKLFNQDTQRIVILGAGGMGKTSLARTVLHHEQIITKYQGNRFFVACDTASNKVELAGLVGAHLGMKPRKDLTQSVLWYFSDAPPSLLILDNLETPWEPVESRKDLEEFLSLLTDITSLALMMFIDIADDRHSMEEVDQVLHPTDNMPLSISLLAHLVDIEGCTKILSRWETERTSLISDGHDKRSNLELSISLSLSSPRVTHSQDLLALLSILPDGLSDVELKQSKFPVQDILSCKAALLRTALAYTDDHQRSKVLVPVREYLGRISPPTDQMIRPLIKHFHELLELYATVFGKESGALPIARITSNYTNIQNVLRYGLQLDHPEMTRSIYCICDFSLFTRRLGHAAAALMEDITCLLPSLHEHRLSTYFIVEMFNSLASNPIFEPEMLTAEAVNFLKHFNDPKLESKLHGALAWYYEHTHDMPKAVHHGQTALFLAQADGDYRGQCVAFVKLSLIEWLRGNYTAGQAYAQEAQKVAKISGDLFQEAHGLYSEALCMKPLGYYKHANSLLTRARTLLGLCGMSYTALDYDLMNSQAEVQRHKSEYVEAHNIHNQILQKVLGVHNPYQLGFARMNIAEIEVFMEVSKDLIQEKIDAAQAIGKASKNAILITACDTIQADLNLREGDMSSLLFCKCLQLAWGNFSAAVTYCLERLGDHSRWEGSSHPSSWTTVFLLHSLKVKERLAIHKALQFLGDIFLRENDEVTAISLFTLALEGFTQMDVHRSRAECMIRLGDICKKNGDLLKALELWETARPLFERSSQVKRVQDIDERLGGIGEEVKEQHRLNLAQLLELNAAGKVEELEDDSSENELERENIGLVVVA
ncbi:hypothetical protein C8F04DRAFT_1235566 [Mycena alexandri]|uniref:Novel STAND NTPase 1 domain-containing protein n=1 Tax=Mycena alexandri TaxID=1745969 RepID=A0AAD6SRK0_9AGAR|nr:hypothetical protein C8F04DRAFT_1235566 [Mycena alexandri]